MEPKILEEDRDEWIYNSMQKYSNLYMFELEFPADTFEVIDETSICLSGCQPYSKKTEILQLALPPKLFPKDIEEGLCKDRDFQIVSGGYASSTILQIKPIKSSTFGGSLVTCTQAGEQSVTLYQLGDENCAVIKESCKLNLDPTSTYSTFDAKQSPGVIATNSSSVYLATPDAILEWDLNSNITASPMKHALSTSTSLGNRVTKIKLWESSTSNPSPTSFFLLGDNGVLILHDLRTSSPSPPMSFVSSRSSMSTPTPAPPEILYSFSLRCSNTLGLVDSCGGYETFDIRSSSPLGERKLLPFFGDDFGIGSSGVLRDKFNIQYSPIEQGNSTGNNPCFVVSGLASSAVHILKEIPTQGVEVVVVVEPNAKDTTTAGVEPIFIHDGHSKRVSSAVLHPTVERLVFSAGVDSMLHAWQWQ